MLGPLVRIVGDRPDHVGAGGDAVGQNVLLLGIVVAAAADDQQGADRPLGVRVGPGHAREAASAMAAATKR